MLNSAESISHFYLNYSDMRREIENLLMLFHLPSEALVETLGVTPEGRDIVAIRVYPRGRDKSQPTLWVDAGMHSAELVGTNVVLAQLLYLADSLQSSLTKSPSNHFYDLNYVFIPRISPDGAECYFSSGKLNRSTPRHSHLHLGHHSYWHRECLLAKAQRPELNLALMNQTQRIGVMRKQHASGVWVCDTLYPGLMRRRVIGDVGPFYEIYPEGTIVNFDGQNLPQSSKVDCNQTDLNRNFPFLWNQDPQGIKSGFYPGSEPESRAIIAFSSQIPELFFALNYHTFGGVFIRPPENQPDSSLPRIDASVFEFLDKNLEKITGYPAVSGFSEFLYEPGVPLPGTLTDWMYYGLGVYSYVCELWDLPKRLGREDRPFIYRYNNWQQKEWHALFEYDQNENHGTIFGNPWVEYIHPQIGLVEIGELPGVFGIQNPPQNKIKQVILPQLEVFSLLTQLPPKVKAQRLPASKTVSASFTGFEVWNEGFLPSYVSKQKQKLFPNLKGYFKISGRSFPLEDLDGFLIQNTGWLHFAGAGTETKSRLVVTQAHDATLQRDTKISVYFPTAGGNIEL